MWVMVLGSKGSVWLGSCSSPRAPISPLHHLIGAEEPRDSKANSRMCWHRGGMYREGADLGDGWVVAMVCRVGNRGFFWLFGWLVDVFTRKICVDYWGICHMEYVKMRIKRRFVVQEIRCLHLSSSIQSSNTKWFAYQCRTSMVKVWVPCCKQSKAYF